MSLKIMINTIESLKQELTQYQYKLRLTNKIRNVRNRNTKTVYMNQLKALGVQKQGSPEWY